VAFESPVLWTLLNLTTLPENSSLWTEWIARSGVLPARLRVWATNSSNVEWLELNISRIRHLTLSRKTNLLKECPFPQALSNLNTLRSFSIEGSTFYPIDAVDRMKVQPISDVPIGGLSDLHDLRLETCAPSASFLQGMRSLHSLGLRHCNLPRNFFAIIGEMPRLRVVVLVQFKLVEPDWHSILPIYLPNLEGLYSYSAVPSTFLKFLSLIHAPRLRVLISDVDYDGGVRVIGPTFMDTAISDYFDGITKAGYVTQTLHATGTCVSRGSISTLYNVLSFAAGS
jgi:hypothetical protein